jgi:glycosyltransferase involved in cell wall biosynthesis
LPVVAWLGRVSSEKRALWFVELAAALDGKARFVLAGTGPELAEVERAARGVRSLEVVGFVEDGVSFLDGSDLVVLTSEVEGISVVAMEAIARGIPVVSTDVGGMADLIEPGVNGELVSADDSSELIAVVGRLLDQRDELRMLQERTREAGLDERFTLEAMVDRYRALTA